MSYYSNSGQPMYYTYYSGNTSTASSTFTWSPSQIVVDGPAPKKKSLLDLLEERVEDVCVIGRERLAA